MIMTRFVPVMICMQLSTILCMKNTEHGFPERHTMDSIEGYPLAFQGQKAEGGSFLLSHNFPKQCPWKKWGHKCGTSKRLPWRTSYLSGWIEPCGHFGQLRFQFREIQFFPQWLAFKVFILCPWFSLRCWWCCRRRRQCRQNLKFRSSWHGNTLALSHLGQSLITTCFNDYEQAQKSQAPENAKGIRIGIWEFLRQQKQRRGLQKKRARRRRTQVPKPTPKFNKRKHRMKHCSTQNVAKFWSSRREI